MSYEAQAADALGAVEARPPATYLWFGRRCEAPDLAAAIRARLVADFHPTGAARPSRSTSAPAGSDGGAFAQALSQANNGRGSWQGGWRIGAAEDDGETTPVERPDGLRLYAPADDCRDGEVRRPKELRGDRPGTYVALGDTPGPGDPRARLSWTIAAAGAVTLVARVTYALNGAGIPFRLELLDDPRRYGDRDAAWLVVARDDVFAALKLLRPLLRALAPYRAAGAPAFTKPLARGLAVADEPAGGGSFAEHRCGLLADAVLAAGERAERSAAVRLALVRDRFAAAGVSLDAPYLEPGAADAYDRS
ncbi:MAG TPA: T3SS effector HopA1 family protein [Solirubrobacteraceae bacterium]|nr:T3SS effector HopA1 family protein [Solirubrobacteraceae bacterium]